MALPMVCSDLTLNLSLTLIFKVARKKCVISPLLWLDVYFMHYQHLGNQVWFSNGMIRFDLEPAFDLENS